MKIAFISDVHGSKFWLEWILEHIDNWGADRIAVLGDMMYHGPRNPLPYKYDPMGVAELLNARKERIIAVRGNCDSEVDQMQIEYPMMDTSAQICVDGRTFFLTHGHVYSPESHPALPQGSVLAFGHIHQMVLEEKDGVVYFNPSSVALPKEEAHTWGRYEDGVLEIVSAEGNILKRLEI